MPSYKDQLYGYYYDEMSLYHHGVLGQKWGVRRYQNPDGTRTAAGKKRYTELNADAAGFDKRNNTQRRMSNAADSRAIDSEAKSQIKSIKQEARTSKKIAKAANNAEYFRNQKEMLDQRRQTSTKAGGDKYLPIRALNDSRRGRAIQAEANAKYWEAKSAYLSDKTTQNKKNVGQAYWNAYKKNFFSSTALGQYDRYRESGDSVTKAILKTGTIGSLGK